MNKQYDSIEEYYIWVFGKVMKIAPFTGLIAAVTYTAAWLLGAFSTVSLTALIVFDIICLLYLVVALLLKRIGLIVDGKVNIRSLYRVEIVLGALVLLQWNLITYILPAREFWGFAPAFAMLTAFFFHSKVVLCEMFGLSVSITLSWLIMGDRLLPARDGMYMENLTLRIVALGLSFVIIYLLSFFAERFTVMVDRSYKALEQKNRSLEMLSADIIDFTADIIEERDSTSGYHVKRLKKYTKILAEQVADDYPEYGLDDEKIKKIAMACVLHDVGKIAIPDSILLKPGKLTDEEFDVIKKHTTLGAQIIDKLPESVDENYRRLCREICLFHHEKYDGKGYPTGLVGDEIPIAAQIVSVVDCYDALTNERPYKKAFPGELAIHMILNGECGAFSDKMKNSLIACKDMIINNM